MPGLTDFSEDTVLNDMYNAGSGFALATDPWVLLHTGDPGENGTTNASAHARQTASFSNSSAGTLSNDAAIDFTSMPAETIVAWSIWDASTAGNCLQTGWLSTVSVPALMRDADIAAGTVQSHEHGLTTDDRIVWESTEGGAASWVLPNTLVAGTLYFVRAGGLTADAFTFASTSGGAAIIPTTSGSGIVRKVTPKVCNSGDTFRIAIGDLDIYATE